MKRLPTLLAAMLVLTVLWAAPASAQIESSVTGAGEGVFPAGVIYLGVPLNALKVGMGLTVAGSWGVGQFQATLVGVSNVGAVQEIQVEGNVNGSTPSAPNTALFSGKCTVDAGNGSLPLEGVPFAVAVTTNSDGTGTVTLTLGATNLPPAAVNEGYMTVR